MSYVTLLSADGAWRWSPPGRLTVVVPTCKAADVRATAVRAARLGAASSWVLSLDGTLPIDPQSTIACGSAVHLLSACGNGVCAPAVAPERESHAMVARREVAALHSSRKLVAKGRLTRRSGERENGGSRQIT